MDLPEHLAPVGAPLLGPETVIVATHGRRGTGLVGFDRRTGAQRFDQAVCDSAASCLMVDGTVVVNGEGGELVGVAASRRVHPLPPRLRGRRRRATGRVASSRCCDRARSSSRRARCTWCARTTGRSSGRVPNDIIPDLLRVGERCDVYVAEESGHLGAYAAAARLSLVST